MNNQSLTSSSASVLKSVLSLFNLNVIDVPILLWKVFHPLFVLFTAPGIYEVLEHEVTLELCDPQGREAVYRKRQKVRFQQNNVIAYQDQAWGAGEIFADYHCTPGIPVDRYREGQRYRILISLRQTKNFGDIEEIRIERTIRNGFTRSIEDLQVETSHFHQQLSINIVFPSSRPPRQMRLIEHNTARTRALSTEHLQQLPDQRYQLHWETDKPHLFERYMVQWQW
jgi:hypothetical protein